MLGVSIKHCLGFLLVGALLGTHVAMAARSDLCMNTTIILGVPNGSCNIDVTQSKSCTFDFRNISSDFESMCTPSEGTFYEENITWACKVTLAGQSYNVTYSYMNYPACIGSKCTDAEAMEFRESFDTSILPVYETELDSYIFVCDVLGESASIRNILNTALVIFSAITSVTAFM